jgi:hypothetical protein
MRRIRDWWAKRNDRWWVYSAMWCWPPEVMVVKSRRRPAFKEDVSGPFDEGSAIIEADRRQRRINAVEWEPENAD